MHPEVWLRQSIDPTRWVWKVVTSSPLRGNIQTYMSSKAFLLPFYGGVALLLLLIAVGCACPTVKFVCQFRTSYERQVVEQTTRQAVVSTRLMHPPDGAAFSSVSRWHSSSTCGAAAFTCYSADTRTESSGRQFWFDCGLLSLAAVTGTRLGSEESVIVDDPKLSLHGHTV
eukprot:5629349-Amphidinium_carterae.1